MEKMLISFSGGRTSAYMMYRLITDFSDKYEFKIVFANTGKEDEETLKFVDRCAKEWNVEIIWVEGIYKDDNGLPFTKKGWGVKHKIVTFETASRNGQPFEELISVLGIPSSNVPFCSFQLKRKPIEHYMKTIGWKKYKIAIGIRNDEVDRISSEYKKRRIVYPLISKDFFPTNKPQILDWFLKNLFDLQCSKNLGNCDLCWKKGTDTLIKALKEKPQIIDWWQNMTNKYSHFAPRTMKKGFEPPFNFYRTNMSPNDLLKLKLLSDKQLDLFVENEKLDGCSESCEPF